MGIQINLFGSPKITLDGTPVTGLKSAKGRALLFYLAATGRAHTRPTLAGLLWGEMPEAEARANLRKAIQQVRAHIGDFLVSDRETVALDCSENCWVDAAAFDRILDEAKALDQPFMIQEALVLYTGDFLEEFYLNNAPAFESWYLLERARLRERFLISLMTLADAHTQKGELQEAIVLMCRYLALEPWREDAHRRLMLLLAQDGQRGAALMQYETCRRILADELDATPSEATSALFRRIQVDEIDRVPSKPVPVYPVEPVRPSFLAEYIIDPARAEAPFVGRLEQLSKLDEVLGAALAGQGGIFFVSAEAGWGKTSLLRAFSRRAQSANPELVVLYGACTGAIGEGEPYQPFRDVARMLAGEVEGMWEAGAITRDHALRIWHLLPQTVDAFLSHGPDLTRTLLIGRSLLNRLAANESASPDLLRKLETVVNQTWDTGQQSNLNQERIYRDYVDTLQHVSQAAPILIILDDLHWVDHSSVGLLFHLARQIGESRIMVLGAYRPEDVDLGRDGHVHPLTGILGEIKQLYGDVLLHLGSDEPSNSLSFVNALIDLEPNNLDDAFRRNLSQTTRDHPLFVVEILRNMKDQGYLVLDQEDCWVESPTIAWDSLPSQVEGVIEKRVNQIAPSLRDLLTAASVEGEEFTAEVLANLMGMDVRETISILSGALARQHHLVKALGVSELGSNRISRYHFSNYLFQKFVYDTIDPIERAYLHQGVGEALESLYEDHTEQVAIQLGRHFQEARLSGKAVKYFSQAGDTAMHIYAAAEAAIHYRTAINLARQINLVAEVVAPLYTSLGRALELDSQFDQVLRVYEEMEELARESKNRSMELDALVSRVTIQAVPTAVHDPLKARQLGERALELAGRLGDQPAETKILWSLSLANFLSGNLDEAIACGERSLSLARQLNSRDQMAQTLNDLGGFIYLYSGRIHQAEEALREAGELWHELGNTPMYADSLSGLCITHVYAGQFDQAIRCSNQAFQISQEIKNVWGQSYSYWGIGEVYLARADYSQAINVMEECIRLGELANFVAPLTYTRSCLAIAYSDLGLLDHALELVQLGLEVAQTQIPTHNPQLMGTLARLQIKIGDLDAAEMTIEAGRMEPSRHSWVVFYLPVLFAEAELYIQRGEYRQALEAADDLIERLDQYEMYSRLAEALNLKGIAYVKLGQDESARKCLLESRQIAGKLGERRTLWRTLFALSRLENEPVVSEALLRDARQVVESIASQIHQDELKRSFLHQPEVEAIFAKR